MSRTSIAVLALACAALAASTSQAETRTFGKPLQGLKPTPLKTVLEHPKDGQVVRLEGTIDKVCQNKGCWLELTEESSAVHVMFEGYSFFVPRDSEGSKVALEGIVKVKEPDPGDVKHFQGEGAGEAAAQRVSIVASGVVIESGDGKEKKQ